MSSIGTHSHARRLFAIALPILLALAIWCIPVPKGLSPQAWHMFAIFAATIAGILTQPLPSGAVMLIAIARRSSPTR